MWVCGPVRFVQLFGCRSFELRVCRTSLIFSLPPALHSQARTAHISPRPSLGHSLCAGAHGGQVACEEDLAARVLRRLERLLMQSELPQLQPSLQHSGPLEEKNQFSQPLFGMSAPLPRFSHSASMPKGLLQIGGTTTGEEFFCGDVVQRSNVSSSAGARIPMMDEPRASAGGSGSQELMSSGAAARETAPSSSQTEISVRMPSMDGSVHSSYTDGRAPSMSEMAPGGGSITGRISPAWKLPSENIIQGLSVDVLAVRIGQFRLVQQGLDSAHRQQIS